MLYILYINIYVFIYIKSNVPSWLYGLKKHTGTYPRHKKCSNLAEVRYMYNIRNHCLVITKNGFVATQALGYMMYVMYSEFVHCI